MSTSLLISKWISKLENIFRSPAKTPTSKFSSIHQISTSTFFIRYEAYNAFGSLRVYVILLLLDSSNQSILEFYGSLCLAWICPGLVFLFAVVFEWSSSIIFCIWMKFLLFLVKKIKLRMYEVNVWINLMCTKIFSGCG